MGGKQSLGGEHSRRNSFYSLSANDEVRPEVALVKERCSQITKIPLLRSEKLQISRYESGMHYNPHFDNHAATVIIYLSDVESGGETAFPMVHRSSAGRVCPWIRGIDEVAYHAKKVWADVCRGDRPKTLAVTPKRGSAVLFYSKAGLAHGEVDPLSIHGGCPVIKGSKVIAQQWFTYNRFNMNTTPTWPSIENTPLPFT